MPSSSSILSAIFMVAAMQSASAFLPSRNAIVAPSTALRSGNDGQEKFSIPNPFAELGDMFQSLDDVIDDFFNKRMGNGEVFYGKRKYKPSGQVDTEYNGGGFSDWGKMEAARQFREERAMLKELEAEKTGAGKKE